MGFDGLVVVSDPYLQRRFTQADLRALEAQYAALRDASPSGRMRLRDLPAALSSLGGKQGAAGGDAEKENSAPGTPGLTDEEWASVLKAISRTDDKPHQDASFKLFLHCCAKIQLQLKGVGGARKKVGGSDSIAASSFSSTAAFLTAATTTLLHTISESEKGSYVGHINTYLAMDPFLKNALPIDPVTNHLFHLTKAGVLLCKLTNLAMPRMIDECHQHQEAAQPMGEEREPHALPQLRQGHWMHCC